MISVIIPIYKVEKYLNRCVMSIVNQTYQDLEIILVDDGSPDNCPMMCDEWAEKDNRIKVIHKENGGLSDARNAGVAVATGQYIGFVDSDDYISADMYELLLNKMIETDSDITTCGIQMVWEDKSEPVMLTRERNQVLENREALQALLEESWLKQPVWSRLYKREIIENILFEKGKYHEDVFWSYQAIAKAKRVCVVDKVGYYYLQRSNSIMGEDFSEKRLDALQAYKERVIFLKEKYPELEQKEKFRCCFFCMYLMQHALKCGNKKMQSTIEAYVQFFQKTSVLGDGLKEKVWMRLSKVNFKATCRLRNFLRIGL